ncbi:GAF domain-containing protein [Methylobacterium sp. J-030]|uniref:GAF domain-containing protein n=1 Tax=Methylobacterium sp. J-030 TaxID=2836627 RepID=UPI001FBB0389|nr:GAF domain-containing protein [Methylobacterium sp. J-030]MCJ2071635.1 GAF domain-containing protein [Methylobacterium sp. J-030]
MSEDRLESDQPLVQVSRRLEASHSLDEIVTILRDTARQIAGSDSIAVVLREGDCCHYVAEDAIGYLWRGKRFPLDTCISGWAMLNNQTAIVPDIEADPRLPAAAYHHTSMRSLVMVPIGSPEPVAALGAYWCSFVTIDPGTVYRLEALAESAGTALARIQGS